MNHPKKDFEIINELEKNGVIFIDKNNVYISKDVQIGKNTIVYPNVCIWENVEIGQDCIIQTSTMINNNVRILNNTFIGPSCLIRDNCIIGMNCSIGPHCELTRSFIGVGCKLGHKNYIGDAILSDNVKFGAGAIIANSDFNQTYKTYIGENTMIGVNASLIAPINIGSNNLIAAGSTIVKNTDDNQLVIARSQQVNKERK